MISPYVSLMGMLLAAGALAWAGAVVLMAWAILHPPRMSDGKAIWVLKRLSPGDLGMPFENVWFDLRDHRQRPLRLAAWWIPARAPASRCVVMLHGYADAKVGAIAWAPLWQAMGFNILALDLRAHGQSGGALSTGGFWERHDVNAALDQLRAQRPAHTRELVIFGISLGAAVAAATAAGRDDLAGVVLESPIVDYSTAVMRRLERMGAPGRASQRAAIWLAQQLSGARFAVVRLTDQLSQINCPILAIAPADDEFLSLDEARALEQAIGVLPGLAIWRPAHTPHLGALLNDPDEYRRRVEAFIAKLPRPAPGERLATADHT